MTIKLVIRTCTFSKIESNFLRLIVLSRTIDNKSRQCFCYFSVTCSLHLCDKSFQFSAFLNYIHFCKLHFASSFHNNKNT